MFTMKEGGQDVKVSTFPCNNVLWSVTTNLISLLFDELFPLLFYLFQVSIELSFMEAVQGCRKNITFEADVLCETCSMFFFKQLCCLQFFFLNMLIHCMSLLQKDPVFLLEPYLKHVKLAEVLELWVPISTTVAFFREIWICFQL